MIEINGSYLEGGGQILRTATALSAITLKPCRIFNIRASRPNPGLQQQHLQGLKAVAKLSNAELKGAKLGSKEIIFIPKKLKGGEIEIEIPTAGSTGLIFQTLCLPSAFCEEDVYIKIKGGATYGKFAPPMDYIKLVLLRVLEKAGYKCKIEIKKHGFYPKGGAEVEIYIPARQKLTPLILKERGKLLEIKGISVASEFLKRRNVAERQKSAVKNLLEKAKIEVLYQKTSNPGSGITLAGIYENTILGADALGERGKKAEEVGKEAAEKLLEAMRSEACLDEHASDQVLPFIAIAGKGEITVSKITKHALTNAWVIEKFLDVKFEFQGKEGESGKIICKRKN